MRTGHIFIVLVTLFSCKKENYELDQPVDVGIGTDNAYVLSTEYISHSGDKLYAYLNIGVVGRGSHVDILNIPDSAFLDLDFGYFDLIVENVELVQPNANRTSYSSMILIDESYDWYEFDAFNLKTQSLEKLVVDASKDDFTQLAVGSFKRYADGEGDYSIWVNDTEKSGFEQTTEDLRAVIHYTNYHGIGSTSNLYDAIYELLDYTAIVASGSNKSITVLNLQEPDGLNSVNHLDVIERAKELDITINLVQVGNYPETKLFEMAKQTGGFINYISGTSVHELILADLMDKGAPMIGSLDRILSNTQAYYKVSVVLDRKSGMWLPGNKISGFYESNIKYSDGDDRLNNILPFYIEIP